jgi:hypothetical protein
MRMDMRMVTAHHLPEVKGVRLQIFHATTIVEGEGEGGEGGGGTMKEGR